MPRCRMQWMMLQQEKPEDFGLPLAADFSAGVHWLAAAELGVELEFMGEGEREVGMVVSVNKHRAPKIAKGDVIVRIDKRYYRPAEVDTLLGNPSKAKQQLGWEPEISVEQMCQEMMASDLNEAKQKALLREAGY